jgi:signal peptidase II
LTAAGSAARAALVAALVVGADQGTKALVRSGLERGDRDAVFPGIELVNVRNSGIAFGLFEDGGTLLVVIGAIAVLALLAFFVTHIRRPLVWLPTGLLLGGAAGNLIDRAREGAVTDFIDIPLWPAFNLADTSITIGVLALLYVLEGPPRHAGD